MRNHIRIQLAINFAEVILLLTNDLILSICIHTCRKCINRSKLKLDIYFTGFV